MTGPTSVARALRAVVVVASLLVIGAPFFVARYPAMTDLPFHAAGISILRHYADPEWGFARQFSLHPIESPYVTLYGAGALAALVLPVGWATKLAAALMLSLLPAGLAVLCLGMKKSPLWALLGLGLVWNTLTHWGFLAHLGALGLMAGSVGLALIVVERPTWKNQALLAAALLATFFTHVFRFPFAVLGVLLAAALVRPATGRFRPVLLPLAPGVALFALWWWLRPHVLAPSLPRLELHGERLGEIPISVYGGFVGASGDAERGAGLQLFVTALVLGAGAALWRRREAASPGGDAARDRRWRLGAGLVPLLLAALFLALYFTLPLKLGTWFFVYPRELVSAALFLCAALPDLPRSPGWRLGAALALVAGALRSTWVVVAEWRRFDAETHDFTAIAARLPRAPRLLGLVYDHRGTDRAVSPFVHLPAWIQAERGGALYFHLVGYGFYPIRFRPAGPDSPPRPPFEFEWHPEWFLSDGARRDARWFDWFLVRHSIDPAALFAHDPRIRPIAREGWWWLYRRER